MVPNERSTTEEWTLFDMQIAIEKEEQAIACEWLKIEAVID
jgi:hypothetical protein